MEFEKNELNFIIEPVACDLNTFVNKVLSCRTINNILALGHPRSLNSNNNLLASSIENALTDTKLDILDDKDLKVAPSD